jgi:hypothetical protein
MATPPFVPTPRSTQRPRDTDFAVIPPARRSPLRPAAGRRPPHAPGFGTPCPDAGYALLLARLTECQLELEPAERRDDANCAIATIAIRRAGLLGRAPFFDDLAFARALLAYGDGDSADFARWRTRHLAGIARDADLSERLADVAMLVADMAHPPTDDTVSAWQAALRQAIERTAPRHAIT